jgi:hypothetical protein
MSVGTTGSRRHSPQLTRRALGGRPRAKAGNLDPDKLASCLRKLGQTLTDPSGRQAAEAMARCLQAALSRR